MQRRSLPQCSLFYVVTLMFTTKVVSIVAEITLEEYYIIFFAVYSIVHPHIA